MRLRLMVLAFLFLFGSLFMSGCSQDVSILDYRDSTDSIMKRARAKVAEGDIDAAIKLYRKVLNDESRQARAHLDLALLLSDKHEYLDAICHYKRYLAMRPNTEKRDMIEARLQPAIQSFIASQTPDSSLRATGGGRKNGTKDNKFATTLQKLKEAEYTEAKLRKKITELKKENKKLQRKVEGCEGELEQYRVAIGLDPLTDKKKPVKSKPKTHVNNKPRTYRVRRGDSLSSIAKDVYGDEKQWVKLKKANKKILRGGQKIKTGQILVIP